MMQRLGLGKSELVVCLIIIHAAFFIYACRSGNIYLQSDSDEYLTQAENINHHASWYQGNWNEAHKPYLDSRRPPLTGFVFMIAKQIYNSDYTIIVLQNLLSIFNLLLAVKTSHFFFNTKNHWLFLIPLLFFPTQMIYANMIMAETLFQSCTITAAYFLIVFSKERKTISIFLFHLFLAGAVLTKPVLFLLWAPLLLFYVGLVVKKKLKIMHAATVLVFIIPVFLIAKRNHETNGVFQYSSASENFFPNYAVLNTLQLATDREHALTTVVEIYDEANKTESYPDYHKAILTESFKQIKKHPAEFILLSGKGMIAFFIDPGRWDIFTFIGEKPGENMKGFFYYLKSGGIKSAYNYLFSYNLLLLVYLLVATVLNIFVAGSFFLFLIKSKANNFLKWILFVLAIYIVACTGIIGSARYRMSIFPLLLMTFPYGIFQLQTFVKKRLNK